MGRSLGQEDPLEKGMTTHSSILAWRIPGMEEPGGLLSVGSHSPTHVARLKFPRETGLILRCAGNPRPPPIPQSSSQAMASGPMTSWQIDGETMETVTDFILGGSKITEDGDCSHEIKTFSP